MNSFMKKTLVGFMLADVMTGAMAQNTNGIGAASGELREKMMAEVKAELPAEQQSDEVAITAKLIEKMRADLDVLKEATVKDCVTIYGEEKMMECSCIGEKSDYEGMFAKMEKDAAMPDRSMQERMQEMQERMEIGKKIATDCGITQEDSDRANARIRKLLEEERKQKENANG